MLRTLTVLAAALLVAACATSERMTTAQRLEFYRAHAGEPVRSIRFTGRLWGWRPLGDGRVSAGFDSVVMQRSGVHGSRTTCRIDTIRPLNTQVVKEAKHDLQDVDLVERDPSVPDEPQ